MGQLTIRKLREEAKAQLGTKFDIKGFHDEVLNGGAMPLELLQQRVERWLSDQAARGGGRVAQQVEGGLTPSRVQGDPQLEQQLRALGYVN